MKNKYTFKHIDPSAALEEHTEKQLQAIGRFLLKDGSAQVYYSKLRGFFKTEIMIRSGGGFYKAEHRAEDAYESVNGVVSKLHKQILKARKSKQENRRQKPSRGEVLPLTSHRRAA